MQRSRCAGTVCMRCPGRHTSLARRRHRIAPTTLFNRAATGPITASSASLSRKASCSQKSPPAFPASRSPSWLYLFLPRRSSSRFNSHPAPALLPRLPRPGRDRHALLYSRASLIRDCLSARLVCHQSVRIGVKTPVPNANKRRDLIRRGVLQYNDRPPTPATVSIDQGDSRTARAQTSPGSPIGV
jgi:hypothetical protein